MHLLAPISHAQGALAISPPWLYDPRGSSRQARSCPALQPGRGGPTRRHQPRQAGKTTLFSEALCYMVLF